MRDLFALAVRNARDEFVIAEAAALLAPSEDELDALRQRARHEELVTRYLREFFSETKRGEQ